MLLTFCQLVLPGQVTGPWPPKQRTSALHDLALKTLHDQGPGPARTVAWPGCPAVGEGLSQEAPPRSSNSKSPNPGTAAPKLQIYQKFTWSSQKLTCLTLEPSRPHGRRFSRCTASPARLVVTPGIGDEQLLHLARARPRHGASAGPRQGPPTSAEVRR